MRYFVVILSVLWLAAPLSTLRAADNTVTLPNCLLSLDEEVQAPAQEAGVLKKIPVHEGQQVANGDLLAQIDDILPQMKYNIAYFKLEVAKKQAHDDIEVRFAIAAYQFAAAKLQRSLTANQKNPQTVSDTDVDEQRLEKEKYKLSIEKARKDLDVAVLQQGVSEAELKAAAADLDRRKLISPLDAEVVELTHHEGEWVQPGDTVMRLVRLDLLRVEGSLNSKKYRPSEIQGCPVNVVVELVHGRHETFPGKIVFVSPLVRAGGDFQVRAEVKNRKQDGFWVLNPGLPAEMTIQLK